MLGKQSLLDGTRPARLTVDPNMLTEKSLPCFPPLILPDPACTHNLIFGLIILL